MISKTSFSRLQKKALHAKYITFFVSFIFAACTSSTDFILPDLTPVIEKDVAILAPKTIFSVRNEALDDAKERVEKRLETFPSFNRFVSVKKTKEILGNDNDLLFKREEYASTFAMMSVADKNIGIALGKRLNVEQYFVIQADDFPCDQCDTGRLLALKFKLINAETSELIWRAQASEKLDEDELEPETYKKLVLEMVENVMDDFTTEFIIPWHQVRYNKLAQLRAD